MARHSDLFCVAKGLAWLRRKLAARVELGRRSRASDGRMKFGSLIRDARDAAAKTARRPVGPATPKNGRACPNSHHRAIFRRASAAAAPAMNSGLWARRAGAGAGKTALAHANAAPTTSREPLRPTPFPTAPSFLWGRPSRRPPGSPATRIAADGAPRSRPDRRCLKFRRARRGRAIRASADAHCAGR